MALYEKLNSIDLNDTNSMRSLFLDFIKEINYQKEEINQLRRGCDQLRTEKEELSKRVTKLERYSSFMCLTFHGAENGGEYPVHKIVDLAGQYKFQLKLMILRPAITYLGKVKENP